VQCCQAETAVTRVVVNDTHRLTSAESLGLMLMGMMCMMVNEGQAAGANLTAVKYFK
jgi:hypothetical protein